MAFYLTSDVLRAARALVGVSQIQLAEHADVGPNVVRRSEKGGNVFGDALHKLRSALEASGVTFISGSEISRADARHCDYLRAGRAFAGMSQADLAAIASIDQKSISNAEKGRNLTRQTEASIRKALTQSGVSFNLSGEKIVSVSQKRSKRPTRTPASKRVKLVEGKHGK